MRTSTKLSLIKCRTATYQGSFLPSGVKAWNDSDSRIKNCESPEQLKQLLKNKSKPNSLYTVSFNRRANVLMTRLRCLRNDLNLHLNEVGLCETTSCDCGAPVENITHYFTYCPKYDLLRVELLARLPLECWTTRTILFGSERYSLDLNKLVQITDQEYVYRSNRFN